MATNYSPKIVTDGLVLCLDAADKNSYPGSGTTWYDLGPNGNNGTLQASTMGTVSGSNTMAFDGGSTKVTLTETTELAFGTGNFSISMWLKASSTIGTYSSIFDKGNPSNSSTAGYQLFLSGGSLRYNISNGSGNWSELVVGSSPDMRDDAWHHFVWAYNGSNIKFYLDNVLLDTDTWANGSGSPTADFKIGDSWVTNFTGEIPIFIIYNKELTAKEISQNFNAHRSRFGV